MVKPTWRRESLLRINLPGQCFNWGLSYQISVFTEDYPTRSVFTEDYPTRSVFTEAYPTRSVS